MIQDLIKAQLSYAIQQLFGAEISPEDIVIEKTAANFEGDFTYVVFPLLKISRKNPEQTAQIIGDFLLQHFPELDSFQVVKGFLNLSIKQQYWLSFLQKSGLNQHFGMAEPNSKEAVLVEYSSPNTNKPLHLGHIRNNLLGYAVAQILKANGHQVYTCNLVNDRGIHICKSMYAWMQYGNGETPESAGLKGDHLVGKYYVIFDKQYKQEIKDLIQQGLSEDEAAKQAPSILAAQ